MDKHILLGGSSICIFSTGISLLIGLCFGIIIVLSDPGDKLVGNITKGEPSNNNDSSNNHHKGECLDSKLPSHWSIIANAVSASLSNSGIKLIPGFRGNDSSPYWCDESPELPTENENDFKNVKKIANRGVASIIVIESSCHINACLNRAENNVG